MADDFQPWLADQPVDPADYYTTDELTDTTPYYTTDQLLQPVDARRFFERGQPVDARQFFADQEPQPESGTFGREALHAAGPLTAGPSQRQIIC